MRLNRTLWVACIGTVLLSPAGAADEGDEGSDEEEDDEESGLAFTVGPGCVQSTSTGQVSVNSGSCLQIVRGTLRDVEGCNVWYQPDPMAPTSASSGAPVEPSRSSSALC